MWVSRVKLEDVEWRLVRAEKRLAVLECHHNEVEFAKTWDFFGLALVKRCLSCEKVLEVYDSLDEFEAARIAHEEKKLAAQKKALVAKRPKGQKK